MAFVKGAVWGLVVGGLGAAGASLIAPQPARNAPPAPMVVAGAVPNVIAAPVVPEPSEAALATAAEPAAPQIAPEPVMTAPVNGPAAPLADTSPAAQPEAAVVSDLPSAPPTTPAAAMSATAEAPVLPNPQSLAPEIPVAEQDVTISTAPPAPLVVEPPEAPAVTAVIVPPEPPVLAPAPEEGALDLPEAPSAAMPREAGPADAANGPEGAEAIADLGAGTENGVAVAVPPVTVAGPKEESATTPVEKEITGLPQKDSADIAPPVVVSIIDAPPRGLPGAGRSVIVKRSPDPMPEAVPTPQDIAAEARAPALVRHAAFFSNPEGLPLMSVLLIDDGGLAGAVRAVSEIPFPVTVLLDPAQAGAAARMADWRSAGFEVASLAALPDGATPSDVAVALAAGFDTLPETVALVDIGTGAVQSEAGTAAQVIENLADAGRGLVLSEGGLNPALRVAAVRDVPAATIFRDLDDSGQDARVIRRFVDQAAFRARQEPGVILLGRVRPETISALILWGTANRAGQVALAPLSATLLAE